MTNDHLSDEEADQILREVMNSADLMIGAQLGGLDTPVSVKTSASGTEAEALGSVRHIAEYIEESEHGYSVDIDYLGESTPTTEDGERHRFELTVTEGE